MATEQDLKYTADHEWVDAAGDIATVGITAYAAAQLGDIVFVDLPSVGDEVEAGQVIGELESTKSVGELFCPVSGTITEVNDEVTASPEVVNSDPFGAGWLLKVQVAELPELMDKAAYDALTGAA
ncbi:glycine cleavage system protein GcvH [Amnibacterium sp.]|uniref:glycine cleavage system protein GcvH n=1 Tax=Amnibacterium sp. TaxID=1872496 RepID=UPI003F7C4175